MRPRPSRPAAKGGFTIIEFIVAIVISGIAISLALFSWTFISRHTTLQKRKSAFYAQTEQAAALISNDIRTSPQVIYFNDQGITFLSRGNGDTVTYRLDSDTLRKNDTAVRYFSEGAIPVKFSIEKDQTAPLPSPSRADSCAPQDIALIITLGAKDRTGLTSEIRSRVKIRYTVEEGVEYSRAKWNY
ncbi:MAG TPA: type II secretion system protein [Chitinivibrionales bacterium]|nr:type II secretion system protein [Chitinivibrionales bacterium]